MVVCKSWRKGVCETTTVTEGPHQPQSTFTTQDVRVSVVMVSGLYNYITV